MKDASRESLSGEGRRDRTAGADRAAASATVRALRNATSSRGTHASVCERVFDAVSRFMQLDN